MKSLEILQQPPCPETGLLLLTVISCRSSCYNIFMSTISVQDIQRDLLAFFRRVEAGESFLVISGEHSLAEVRALATPATQPRPFGLCAGQFKVPADFDRPLPEDTLKEFEGA
jgi:antitoxin (DNA-binding transcriptional repressor) of toxin-antitoxin stability system